jgi:hypothetical protein
VLVLVGVDHLLQPQLAHQVQILYFLLLHLMAAAGVDQVGLVSQTA